MAGNKFAVSVVISAVDKVTANVRKISEGLERRMAGVNRIGESFKSLSEAAGVTKVSDAYSRLSSATGKVKDEVGGLLSRFALFGGTAVAGLFLLTKTTASAAGRIKDLGTQSGFSFGELQKLMYAGEQMGIDTDSLSGSILTFTKNMGMARAGTGKLAGLLRNVNPAFLDQLKHVRNNEEGFDLMLRSIKRIPDPMRRMALATAAFGADGGKMILMAQEGSAELNRLKKEAVDLGLVMGDSQVLAGDNFEDTINRIMSILTSLRNTIASALIPIFQKWADDFVALVSRNQASIQKFAAAFATFVGEVVPQIAAAAQAFFGFFAKFDENAGKITVNVARVKMALAALAIYILGPAVAAIYSLTAAVVSFGIALMATPIGWVIAGVAALVGVGLLLWDNWDQISTFFAEIWDNPTKALWGFVETMWTAFKWVAARILDIIGLVVAGFFEAIVGIGRAIGAVVGTLARVVGVIPGLGGVGDWGKNLAEAAVGRERPTLQPATTQSLIAGQSPLKQESKVTVDFTNLPRGTKVRSDNTDGVNLDLGLSYGPMASLGM